MENFVFALNATMPVFFIILLGYVLQRIGLTNENFNNIANRFVFKVALPANLFMSICNMDFYSDFDPSFCLFCFLVTNIMFLGVWGGAWLLMKDRTQIGAFSQASVRSSAAILGIAFATNIYGNVGLVPMMILSAVPFFNIYAVLILTLSPQVDEDGRLLPRDASGGAALRKACRGVATNPIILGILAGVPFALLRIKLPVMLSSAITTVGNTTTPLGLLVVGAGFSGSAVLKKWRPAVLSSAIKLFVLPLLFLPIAAALGFRDSQMVAILIMVGSPTTVTCYVMAKSMHGDAELSSGIIVLTTLLSSVSITLWLYLLRVYALI